MEPCFRVQGDTEIQNGIGIDVENVDEVGILHGAAASWGVNSAFENVRPHYGVLLAHIVVKLLLIDYLLIVDFLNGAIL